LLLVVLAMLVLFMLIGTAFIMTSGQSMTAAKDMAKSDRLGNVATELQERALMQLLRDTENPASVVQSHGLLRDYYGTDGFEAVAEAATYARDLRDPASSPLPVDNTLLGVTQGQLIDIYVAPTLPILDNPGTNVDESIANLDARSVIKLDRDAIGRPQAMSLPYSRGYYNGCLLTITSGPAAGQSARIVDYQFMGTDPWLQQLFPIAKEIVPSQNQNQPGVRGIWRFRVVSFSRRDGNLLNVTPAALPQPPSIDDLAGESFLVNGRPFNGTGVGFNPAAQAGSARLSALQLFNFGGNDVVGAEYALLPNARHFDGNLISSLMPGAVDPFFPRPFDPTNFIQLNELAPVLPPNPTHVEMRDHAAAKKRWLYPRFAGPGDADEGYDAADFQNMWLALQTVTPRAQGRVVAGNDPTGPVESDIYYPVSDFLQDPSSAGIFRRIDLEDVPLPSFHRPDLINFWYHRLVTLLVASGLDESTAVQAILQPYQANGQPHVDLSPEQASLIAAIKRRIMMRPIREDHPNFDGGNPQSVAFDYSNVNAAAVPDPTPPVLPNLQTFNITVPIWEIVGPWDVDNDNDGVADSVWLDFGEPVQELEDGTRYKVLIAPLIIDLDSRLNVNAHGLVDHVNPAALALAFNTAGVAVPTNLAGAITSNLLPQGLGMGPPEISLRPVFPQPLDQTAIGNRTETGGNPAAEVDSYATLFAGRQLIDGTSVSGKYGNFPGVMTDMQKVAPGTNYDYNVWKDPNPFTSPTGDTARASLAAQLKFFDYPFVLSERSAFGTPADLFGRYALGLDYSGQPYYEVLNDLNPATKQSPRPEDWRPNHMLVNSPYELDLSRSQRRQVWSAMTDSPGSTAVQGFNSSLNQSDDAPFSLSDLERVLRAWDAESGALPSRLWDVVNAFDPIKLLKYESPRVTGLSNAMFAAADDINDQTPEKLATAQLVAGINRRLVTTDSYTPPIPSITPPAYLLTVPEKILYDVDIDDRIKQAYLKAINRKPPGSLAEMLELRIRRELGYPVTAFDDYDPNGDHDLDDDPANPLPARLNASDPDYQSPDPATAAAMRVARAARINTIIQQLIAPELLAGKRMDLNRPFGDGRDSAFDFIDNDGNGQIDEPNEPGDYFVNGVVDDPMEAGDPFLDINGNGKWDDPNTFPPNGEPFINVDGNLTPRGEPLYTPPRDRLWQNLASEPITFDYTNGWAEPIHPLAVQLLNVPVQGGVRNLDSQGRQLFARHLYCLMLLLVDEGYIAPWDENDPQIQYLLEEKTGDGFTSLRESLTAALNSLPTPPLNPSQEARRMVLRKITCQAIAQWAVNCVDMRDADAIMTPFEYDEYPWDGWGVPDGTSGANLPLDGDVATDENKGQYIDWEQVPEGPDDDVNQREDNGTKVIKAFRGPTNSEPDPPTPLNQTRGIVWGAERPELLITETLAYHNRNTEDLADDYTQKTLIDGDPTLDQRLRPKGSLYVELFNPWSPTGQYPAEIYSMFNTDTGLLIPDRNQDGIIDDRNGDGLLNANDIFMGVELGRLSTMGAKELATNSYRLTKDVRANPNDTTVKRSPVWRMVVVEENPKYRQSPNNYPPDDDPDPFGTGVHTGDPPSRYAQSKPGFFEAADPDRPSFYGQGWPNPTAAPPAKTDVPENEPYIERSIYFTTDNSKRLTYQDPDDPAGGNENYLSPNPKHINDRLRIPPQFVNAGGDPRSANYFITTDSSDPRAKTAGAADLPDVAIAPIRPGRYAIVGTAGAQYYDRDSNTNKKTGMAHMADGQPPLNLTTDDPSDRVTAFPRFVNTISRRYIPETGGGGDSANSDNLNFAALDKTPRIELFPSPYPDVQQVLVASNGGTPLFPRNTNLYPTTGPDRRIVRRDNEVAWLPPTTGSVRFRNIYDGVSPNPEVPPNDPNYLAKAIIPDAALIPPCVAIPIMNLSVSEPIDLYDACRRNLEANDVDPNDPLLKESRWYFNPEAANGEGMFVASTNPTDDTPTPYNTPFDEGRAEFDGNGTTPNYRTIHLQRLADPTLPWNPPPTLPDGSANAQHDPKLPVNPYRTIDSSGVDLTIFNGASRRELDTENATTRARLLPSKPATFWDFVDTFNGPRRIHFRSLERGTHPVDQIAAPDIAVQIAARALWRQEPINNWLTDMQTWLYIDPNQGNPEQARLDKLIERAKDKRLRDREQILNADIDSIFKVTGTSDEYDDYPDALILGPRPDPTQPASTDNPNPAANWDFVLDHTLGFSNESFGAVASTPDIAPTRMNLPVSAIGNPLPDGDLPTTNPPSPFTQHDPRIENPVNSTFPWLAWNNRPFVSADELLNVPNASASQMLRNYSTIFQTAYNPYDGTGVDNKGTFDPADDELRTVGYRLAANLSPFGHLFNAFQTAATPAGVARKADGTVFIDPRDTAMNWHYIGAAHYYRILEYVHVPSRFVGTDTMFLAETFNDNPYAADMPNAPPVDDIRNSNDPRYYHQPPYNRVSRERDPGKVNLNTVTGRRESVDGTLPVRHWSEVFDGIMHRDKDENHTGQLSHLGPSWRDVVISRKGYLQKDAEATVDLTSGLGYLEKRVNAAPDVYMAGLNPHFPSIFSNPFRSGSAGDLVPLPQMVHLGVDVSMQRRHHFNRGGRGTWGSVGIDDNNNGIIDETREAGFAGDDLVFDRFPLSSNPLGTLLPANTPADQSGIPLFSESFTAPSIDGERNPYFYYQPMTRMENLVTNRSNVFAIWITVGYFEVEPAPDWNDINVQRRFGGDGNPNSQATAAAQARYNRVYPDGYMLGKEVGSDTGDVKRPRGFFIVDRTEEVGFKPGEDLNVEKMIKLRRRIE
jgi:hypothetical protein